MIETFPFVGAMPFEDYHSDAQLPVAALSHGLIHTMLSRSPHHARTACRKLNPLGVHEESATFDRGSAAHAVLFQGEEALVVIDADDWRSKAAKDARDSARTVGLIPLLRKHHDDVRRMADIMRDTLSRCPDLAGLDLAGGTAEQVAIWKDGDILLRIRPDWWNEERDVVLDYKTTAGSANPNAWLKTMLQTGADIQEALYLEGNAATGGAKRALFLFAVQENEEPFATSLVALSPAFAGFAEEKVAHGKEKWRACMRSGEWPGYPKRIAYVEPPAWALTQYAEGVIDGLPGEGEHGIPYDPAKLYAGAAL